MTSLRWRYSVGQEFRQAAPTSPPRSSTVSTRQQAIAQDEIFGPVLTVNSFADEAEAISLANGTEYGLLGAIWTSDISRGHRLAAEIEAGQVYVNTYGAGGGVNCRSAASRNLAMDARRALKHWKRLPPPRPSPRLFAVNRRTHRQTRCA